MSSLSVTLIDVAWGDSIFIESIDSIGKKHFALIDSNDSTNIKSTYIYLKRHFEIEGLDLKNDKPVFDWVMLSHAHLDHGQGLKYILKEFGTNHFYYPKSLAWKSLATLISYSTRSKNVNFHQAIDNTKIFNNLGDVKIEVLWPQYNVPYDKNNENNNSIVLLLALNNISFVLTGDAEEEVWKHISHNIPANTKFFKVPHHGSINGTFDSLTQKSTYLDRLGNVAPNTILGISSHLVPYGHPDPSVLSEFQNRNHQFQRTDRNHHITYSIEENNFKIKYTHI